MTDARAGPGRTAPDAIDGTEGGCQADEMRTLEAIGAVARALTPAVVVAVGCGAPAPHREMGAAYRAISQAQENEAAEDAPLELRQAREKYEAGRRAIAAGAYDDARRLAEEADADARYAEAKARAERARRTAEETRAGIDALRREVERSAIY